MAVVNCNIKNLPQTLQVAVLGISYLFLDFDFDFVFKFSSMFSMVTSAWSVWDYLSEMSRLSSTSLLEYLENCQSVCYLLCIEMAVWDKWDRYYHSLQTHRIAKIKTARNLRGESLYNGLTQMERKLSSWLLNKTIRKIKTKELSTHSLAVSNRFEWTWLLTCSHENLGDKFWWPFWCPRIYFHIKSKRGKAYLCPWIKIDKLEQIVQKKRVIKWKKYLTNRFSILTRSRLRWKQYLLIL